MRGGFATWQSPMKKKDITKTTSQRYQIDQSIKIENTNKTTYVCLANGQTLISSISAKDKKTLKLYFRELERPLIFKIFTFSVLYAKVISQAKIISVEIDEEYSGHEINIHSYIIQILSIWQTKKIDISFTRVGKKSSAHIEGYKAYKKGRKGISINAQDVLVLYNLIDKA